jgi:hypothetical protein
MLESFWEERPDWRLGQIFANLTQESPNLWDIEDEEFEAALGQWSEMKGPVNKNLDSWDANEYAKKHIRKN